MNQLERLTLNGLIQLKQSMRFYSSGAQIKLVLYTKKECQLCDEAKEALQQSYPNRFQIEEVDITKDRTLFRKFKLDIPVFYHNGTFLMQHRIDTTALDRLVNEHEAHNNK